MNLYLRHTLLMPAIPYMWCGGTEGQFCERTAVVTKGADQEKSRHNIGLGADESTWAPFWWPMSLLKYYENVQLVGH